MSFLLIPTEYTPLVWAPCDKNKKENVLRPRKVSKHSNVCAEHFTEDSFEQNLTVRSLLGASFKSRGLELKIDAIPIYTLYMIPLTMLKESLNPNISALS